MTSVIPRWTAFGVVALAILVACGGGHAPVEEGTGQLQGVVLDAAPQSSRVYLDLNNNQSHDEGEPQTAVAPDGTFVLDVGARTNAELASALLVAERPQSAALFAPAAAFIRESSTGTGKARTTRAVISPLTTLVAVEVAFNGMTPAEAVSSVQNEYGLVGKDLLADYGAHGDVALRRLGNAVSAGLAERHGQASGLITQFMGLKTQLAALAKARDIPSSQSTAIAESPQSAVISAAGRTRFIVKLRDWVAKPRVKGAAAAMAHGGEMTRDFSRALKGYVVNVPNDRVQAFLLAMQQDPEVDFTEMDQPVRISQTVQSNATWGIDRTDQRDLPLTTSYSYLATGAGVHAYIIDTGIRTTHVEFTGRTAAGFNAVADGNGTNDCHGHGTHVAGTVGGSTWGMAKGVKLVPVRVLDCFGSGFISEVIAGVDWVAANGVRPAVANMSLGGGVSEALDAAVANSVSSGITFVVAAGNSNANACNFSPARAPSAITVGATTSSDVRASFSNFGTCVDIFAPGNSITSAAITSDTGSTTMSGTSMASPHTAGLAALYLQSHVSASPADVLAAILAAASTDKISSISIGAGSPNALIYTDLASQSAPPEPPISGPQPPISGPQPPISAPEPPPAPGLSVGALSSRAAVSSRGWKAMVTVAVRNPATNALVAGVAVNGAFTVGGSRVSCRTGTNGTCTVTSGTIALATMQTTFTVSGLALRSLPYDPAHNLVTSIVVTKP